MRGRGILKASSLEGHSSKRYGTEMSPNSIRELYEQYFEGGSLDHMRLPNRGSNTSQPTNSELGQSSHDLSQAKRRL